VTGDSSHEADVGPSDVGLAIVDPGQLAAAEVLATLRNLDQPDLADILQERDGAQLLLDELPNRLPCARLAASSGGARMSPGEYWQSWELCGNYYRFSGRHHEALALFRRLYVHMLECEATLGRALHKAMPLVWMHECHAALGHPLLAKRYMMLTAVEDAVFHDGSVPRNAGVYFRLVWQYGMSPAALERYSRAAAALARKHPVEARFPEWILQQLDQDWMKEFPSTGEAGRYEVSGTYINFLLDRMGSGSGRELEQLASYLLGAVPGCRAVARVQSHSTDYDVVCVLEGPDLDFRSELGRYLVCECKDWKRPVDFSAFAKFCRVLDSVKCRFGIIFSPNNLTGTQTANDAKREQLKVFQDRGMVVVVISLQDLQLIAEGADFIAMLRNKYEEVRLDLELAKAERIGSARTADPEVRAKRRSRKQY
jgi:hypothetical protein